MKRGIKITAVSLVFSLVISCIPADISDARSMSGMPEITGENARTMVFNAIEKFKQKDSVGYLLEGNGTWGIYAYDQINEIGVQGDVFSGEAADESDLGLDWKNNAWYDIKNRITYTEDEYVFLEGSDGKEEIYFQPLSDDDIESLRSAFKEFIDLKSDGFVKADSYTYEGLEWKTANGVSHLCYKIGVPDEDPTLYDYDQYYIPKDIYIGVDDGEIYSIHEEYILGTERETVIKIYDTQFFYPGPLSIPAKFKKAILYPYTDLTLGDVTYTYTESEVHSGKRAFGAVYAGGYDEDYEESKITSLSIPTNIKILNKKYPVEIIYDSFCVDQTKLKKVKLGSNIAVIDYGAFCGCTKLGQINIPKGVIRIGDRAFKGCKSLKKITLPDKLKKLGKNAFNGCKKLTEITLGKKLKTLKKNTFKGCNNLKTIKVKNATLMKKLASESFRKTVGISNKTEVVKC